MTQRSYSYLKAPCVLSSPEGEAAQAQAVGWEYQPLYRLLTAELPIYGSTMAL